MISRKRDRRLVAIGALAALVMHAGCSSSTDSAAGNPIGGERQPCYPNQSCNIGLSCLDQVCIAQAQGGAGGFAGAGMSGSVAAATSGANATGSGGASQVGGSATGGSAIGSGGASQTGGASAAGGTADAPGNGGDAGTAGASGDPGSAAFDVTALPGLTLWLDATLGVRMGSGTTIVAWTDQSASKRQFAASPHAGTISLDAIGVNGHPALKIDGGADFYPAAGSVTGFDWASDDFLVEAVTVATGTHRFFNAYEGNAVSQSDLLIDYDTGTPSGGIVNQSGLPVLVSAASASSGAHVVGLQYTQAAAFTLDLRLDGKVLATEMSSPPNIHANSVEVGYALGTGTLEVAEIIVLHGTTSVANRAAIENYLATRYGL